MAQHMLFAEHIVKLVDIYGRSCFHNLILDDVRGVFKRFVKYNGLRACGLTPVLKIR
jgi:hypothetical protein